MIPELEKPKVIEIKVRMDCNGCVQKIKKALYGINGIYDLYIDFPQQKLTIIGWAEPERIMKAIKKIRKVATICSDSEQMDSQPTDNPMPTGGETAYISSMEAPPSYEVMGVDGQPGQSYAEAAPGHVVVNDAHSGPHYDPTGTNGQQTAQPLGTYEVVTHNQPSEHGHVVHQSSLEPGHVVSYQPESSNVVHQQLPEHGHIGHQQSPMHGQVVHHHQPEHSYGVSHHQPSEHSHGHVVHPQPTEHTHSHMVQHHQPEHGHGYTSSYNYHHNLPGAFNGPTSTPMRTVIHSYNTYQPSPYVTEYVRPLTSHRPSTYAYEYIPQQPPTHYSPRIMDRYNEDYYNPGTSSNNGNITSIFSDENPNACNLM